ncbi:MULTISPECIES: nitroreductase family protein [Paenibacillus]|uniref:Nitroreductase n=2 Tax=Paenibacillus lactis TaxID=228574 RepID=G4H8F5_9BACL|nr:nitroreductase family protein [Paenibacillus lactis]EHB68140.1 nitroreductase [Paenibacillus lactis 154]MBP1892110.1 nitroreductase [Paenibacillus lactis]MCM3492795.1 nitroreductase family protein [Paenibacillus lactis]GIO89560.1 putative NAD(P)H nitroreductase YodC [Paenibacillus lactis]HAF98997.1 nitroreductase family protein [Paenibacillus lactis]
MATVVETSVIKVMKERSSVRKYQSGVGIPQSTLHQILEAAATAPSAWNLQHWKFVTIQNQENKERLLPIAYHQQQVADASAVVIVLGDTKANENAENVYGESVRAGFMTEEVKNSIVNDIDNHYKNAGHAGIHDAIRNASFAAMQLMLAAKAHGIDSGPMGGYDAEALRKELNIPDRYIPVLMLTLGYAEQPAYPTNRFPVDQVVIRERF